ncbi:MAG: hypothetical protein HFI69_03675 [Lachnospiraceae bacterium]|nr:hypothetical protein [Lachnospiraceae bacterium]
MIRFFICENITSFIQKQQKEISDSQFFIMENNVKPAFIYAYSIFESTITEILRYYLNAFPEKIEKKFVIEKKDLLATAKTQDIMKKFIDKHIRKFSSETLSSYLTFFFHTLSIKIIFEKNRIEEISSQRNKIIHDDARAELMYSSIHDKEKCQPLSISVLNEYIRIFIQILEQTKEQILLKYHKYTKEFLIRELWTYAFSTPFLNFDNLWEFDNEGILKIKDLEINKERIRNISSSEHLLLSIFLQQYNNDINEYLHSFKDIPPLVGLDSRNKNKLVNIINFFQYHPLFFCGEILK